VIVTVPIVACALVPEAAPGDGAVALVVRAAAVGAARAELVPSAFGSVPAVVTAIMEWIALAPHPPIIVPIATALLVVSPPIVVCHVWLLLPHGEAVPQTACVRNAH
jgi:hypothetical protein